MLWKSHAPRRVQAIIWKILHQRLSTKVSLQAKNVIPVNGDTRCVFCGVDNEDFSHLFSNCQFCIDLWGEYHRQLRVSVAHCSLLRPMSNLINIPFPDKKKKSIYMQPSFLDQYKGIYQKKHDLNEITIKLSSSYIDFYIYLQLTKYKSVNYDHVYFRTHLNLLNGIKVQTCASYYHISILKA